MSNERGDFITTIYNSDFLEKRETEKPQEESHFSLDLRHGITKIDRESLDQLEEDLSTMFGGSDKQETLLGDEKHRQLFKEACQELVRDFGKYLYGYQIQQVFPGIDLNNIETYDFASSKIKFFVLNDENYWNFMSLREGALGAPPSKGTAMMIQRVWGDEEKPELMGIKLPYGYREIHHGESLNYLLIIKEIQSDSVGSDVEKVERYLKHVLKHEVLHALSSRDEILPKDTYEGMVESFASYPDEIDDGLSGPLVNEAKLVRGLVNMLKEADISEQEIGEALLGKHFAALKHLREVTRSRLGESFEAHFFQKGFWNRDARAEALTHIQEKR